MSQVHGQGTLFDDNPEYERFTGKFKTAKTTDDCYTPAPVYDAVAGWVAEEYGLDRARFARPFWPDGDYQAYRYEDSAVVVDNPPFSILSQITEWYNKRCVKFFLFAPAMTLFSGWRAGRVTYIPVGADITYANGASVKTSFVTNLDQWQVRTAPDLFRRVQAANDEIQRALHAHLPKYEYPDHIITAALVHKWGQYGVDFRVRFEDCTRVRALDAQKEQGLKSGIFGSGFLLSDRAAADRAAADRAAADRAAADRAAAEKSTKTVWLLSGRERKIVEGLNHGGDSI